MIALSNSNTGNGSMNCRGLSITGFGGEYEEYRRYSEDENRAFEKAETFSHKQALLQQLDSLCKECSEEGWDGDDAFAISEDVYDESRKFIRHLPDISFIPMPDIIAEYSGEITFEWSKGKRHVLLVTMCGKNEISYVALFGTNEVQGTVFFGDTFPPVIIENLRRLFLL
ncbi:MAG: hypothetical protein HQL03_05990 [Nitrospirae bacterium]|nr:hypothetical protein [Nitrospirota bacterium]MBF0592676.1 hypothetical protein [Nitrospirota bacterium]